MNLISRLLRSFFLLTALLLACVSLSADCFFERGSLADCFDDCVTLLESQRKGEELEFEARTAFKRLLIKGRIAAALNKGEMTLIEAASYFRSLHEDPRSWHNPERPRPARKDGAGWCREAIKWTHQYILHDQSACHAAAVRHRLEAELQEQLDRNDGVTLPE